MKIAKERFNAKWSEDKNRKIRKIKMILAVSMIAVVVIPILIKVFWSIWAHKEYVYADDKWSGVSWSMDDDFDINSVNRLLVPDSGLSNYKIMVLADPQMKFVSWTMDVKTMDLIDKSIDKEKPDLVVCTGDLMLSLFNKKAVQRFCEYMNEKKVYWTFIYGNHDGESGISKSRVAEMLNQFGGEYCLFETGPANISEDDKNAKSNYFINIVSESSVTEANPYGEVLYTLAMIDSNDYYDYSDMLTDSERAGWGYGFITGRQMDYYAWTMQGINQYNTSRGFTEARALTFFHIPLPDFADMWYEYQANSESEKVSDWFEGGMLNENAKSAPRGVYSAYRYYDMVYEKAIPTGYSLRTDAGLPTVTYQCLLDNYCRAVFSGHDHVNNFKGLWDPDADGNGIYLAYGRGSGYHTYPFFNSTKGIGKLFKKYPSIAFDMEKGMCFIDVDLTDGTFDVYEKTHNELK